MDFADDISALSGKKSLHPAEGFELHYQQQSTGLKINSKKTKLFRLKVNNNAIVQVDEHDVKDVESFVLLASYISRSGGTEASVPDSGTSGRARTTLEVILFVRDFGMTIMSISASLVSPPSTWLSSNS